MYASFWNHEQIGFIAPAIPGHGGGAIGNTRGVTRDALARIGGLDAFRDNVAQDAAIGNAAGHAGLAVTLGPLVHSPVCAMSLAALSAQFTRAALYGITMKSSGDIRHHVLLYSRIVVLVLAAISASAPLFLLGVLLAALRLLLGSQLCWHGVGERRVSA